MTASRAMRNRQHAAAVQRNRGRLRVPSVVALGAACTRVHCYANPSALKAAALHVYCAHSDYSYSAPSRPLRAVSATVTDRGRRGFPTAARHERVALPSTRAPGTAALTVAPQRTVSCSARQAAEHHPPYEVRCGIAACNAHRPACQPTCNNHHTTCSCGSAPLRPTIAKPAQPSSAP